MQAVFDSSATLHLLRTYRYWRPLRYKIYAFEWYKDSTAVFCHLKVAGEALNKLHKAVEFTRVKIFVDVSDELVEALKPFNALIFKHWGRFTR